MKAYNVCPPCSSRWAPFLLLVILMGTCVYGYVLSHFGPASFDAPILMWFRDSGDAGRLAGPEWIIDFWLSLTWLGNTTPRIVVAVLTILGLFLLHRWRTALFIAWVLTSGITLSTALKYWLARPRPQLVSHFDQFSSMSYPSGHAFNSTLFYLVIALVIAPLLKMPSVRYCLYVLVFTLSLAIGISRIALGVHWPSDVLAGWIIASTWAFLWLAIAKRNWPKVLI
jgi:undecaprenyl-diphosphatase